MSIKVTIQKRAVVLAGALMITVVSGSREAKADETENGSELQQTDVVQKPRYRVALGGDLAAGGQGFDGETVAGLAELNIRWQVLPIVGVGGTFSYLDTGRELKADVIGLNLSLHPLSGWIDPYLRLGPVYFANIDGKLQYNPDARSSRLGIEGVLGMDFAWRHLAIGPELRLGRTDQHWGMLGVHLEARM